jgi:hypothetical protein
MRRLDYLAERVLPGLAAEVRSREGARMRFADDRSLFSALVEADPTPEGRYVQWMLRLLRSGAMASEDIARCGRTLADFDRLKRRLPKDARDIGRYGSEPALHAAVSPLLDASPVGRESSRLERAVAMEGARTLWEGPEGRVVAVLAPEAARWWGRGTRWCTSSDGSDVTARAYLKAGPLYVILDADGTKHQVHRQTMQFCDASDAPVADTASFLEARPWLRSVPEVRVAIALSDRDLPRRDPGSVEKLLSPAELVAVILDDVVNYKPVVLPPLSKAAIREAPLLAFLHPASGPADREFAVSCSPDLALATRPGHGVRPLFGSPRGYGLAVFPGPALDAWRRLLRTPLRDCIDLDPASAAEGIPVLVVVSYPAPSVRETGRIVAVNPAAPRPDIMTPDAMALNIALAPFPEAEFLPLVRVARASVCLSALSWAGDREAVCEMRRLAEEAGTIRFRKEASEIHRLPEAEVVVSGTAWSAVAPITGDLLGRYAAPDWLVESPVFRSVSQDDFEPGAQSLIVVSEADGTRWFGLRRAGLYSDRPDRTGVPDRYSPLVFIRSRPWVHGVPGLAARLFACTPSPDYADPPSEWCPDGIGEAVGGLAPDGFRWLLDNEPQIVACSRPDLVPDDRLLGLLQDHWPSVLLGDHAEGVLARASALPRIQADDDALPPILRLSPHRVVSLPGLVHWRVSGRRMDLLRLVHGSVSKFMLEKQEAACDLLVSRLGCSPFLFGPFGSQGGHMGNEPMCTASSGSVEGLLAHPSVFACMPADSPARRWAVGFLLERLKVAGPGHPSRPAEMLAALAPFSDEEQRDIVVVAMSSHEFRNSRAYAAIRRSMRAAA